jgi:hypothetical protein
MTHSDSGNAPWRMILIQLGLLVGLLVFFRFYLPHHERQLAAERVALREQKIAAFVQSEVIEDDDRQIPVFLDGEVVKRHPQRLRTTLSPDDVEENLGAPQTTMTDFSGGEHLSWVGTAHRLEAAFNKGRLYCVTYEDLSTHRGVLIYEDENQFHPY